MQKWKTRISSSRQPPTMAHSTHEWPWPAHTWLMRSLSCMNLSIALRLGPFFCGLRGCHGDSLGRSWSQVSFLKLKLGSYHSNEACLSTFSHQPRGCSTQPWMWDSLWRHAVDDARTHRHAVDGHRPIWAVSISGTDPQLLGPRRALRTVFRFGALPGRRNGSSEWLWPSSSAVCGGQPKVSVSGSV